MLLHLSIGMEIRVHFVSRKQELDGNACRRLLGAHAALAVYTCTEIHNELSLLMIVSRAFYTRCLTHSNVAAIAAAMAIEWGRSSFIYRTTLGGLGVSGERGRSKMS